jgi:NAD(P)-dependent dehydrogenase (short-subunit alcohol dehydrogenase family)
MIRLRRGRMIFISSVVGLYGSPGPGQLRASKAGLVGLARSITRELGGRGITANVVAPGFIDTDMTAELPEDTRKAYLAAIPPGRFATPRRSPPPCASWPARGRLHLRCRDPRRRWPRHGPLTRPHATHPPRKDRP